MRNSHILEVKKRVVEVEGEVCGVEVIGVWQEISGVEIVESRITQLWRLRRGFQRSGGNYRIKDSYEDRI